LQLTSSLTGSPELDAALAEFHRGSQETIAFLRTHAQYFVFPFVDDPDQAQKADNALSRAAFYASLSTQVWMEMNEAWRLHDGLSALELRARQSLEAPDCKPSQASRKRVARHGHSKLAQDHGTAATRKGTKLARTQWAAKHHKDKYWRDVRAELARYRRLYSRHS
jgi:hypothetical protein